MTNNKTYRLWKHVEFGSAWKSCDTALIDTITPSWIERREILQNNSGEYHEFMTRLKREHAIETGIIERMYELEKGITETFIKKGFVETYISHNDTNVPVPKLLKHLKDHLDAVDFVFDVVKENREFTIGFIKELHALVTRNQDFAEGRYQFGNKTNIDLLKGQFKIRENNPTREDGTVILYCSPDHVASEMDNLVDLYNRAVEEKIHPLIISTWFHHAFTTIHPFQDGNGRVSRLLSSLILIKFGFFPFTVLREEAKEKYIEALEQADHGKFQPLLDYFMEVQKRNIEKALNLKEINSNSLEEVTDVFSKKLEQSKRQKREDRENLLSENRQKIFDLSQNYFIDAQKQLKSKLNGNANISMDSCAPSDNSRQHFYYGQIIKYAQLHDYYFNRTLPKAWVMFNINLESQKAYQLGITIHHHGYDDNTIVIGAFLEYLEGAIDAQRIDSTLPLDIKPYVLSINKQIKETKGITSFLESALTLTLAHIASEI